MREETGRTEISFGYAARNVFDGPSYFGHYAELVAVLLSTTQPEVQDGTATERELGGYNKEKRPREAAAEMVTQRPDTPSMSNRRTNMP